jgi:hypothetical protein
MNNVCETNNSTELLLKARKFLATYLEIATAALSKPDEFAAVLSDVSKLELFPLASRRRNREQLGYAYATKLLLDDPEDGQARMDALIAAKKIKIRRGLDTTSVALQCFFDYGGRTDGEKRHSRSTLSRDRGGLEYLALKGYSPEKARKVLQERGSGIDRCYRLYVQAKKEAAGKAPTPSRTQSTDTTLSAELVNKAKNAGDRVILIVRREPATTATFSIVLSKPMPKIEDVNARNQLWSAIKSLIDAAGQEEVADAA